jgi:hypothetical protein
MLILVTNRKDLSILFQYIKLITLKLGNTPCNKLSQIGVGVSPLGGVGFRPVEVANPKGGVSPPLLTSDIEIRFDF